MKTMKNYMFSMLLVAASNQYASDEKNKNDLSAAIGITGLVAPLAAGVVAWRCNFSPFGILQSVYNPQQIFGAYILDEFKETDTFVEENYPYAQRWYNDLAKQHPTADLSQHKFLKSNVSAVDSTIGNVTKEVCKALPHRIFFPEEDLKNINLLYKKQIDGQQLTTDEQLQLGEAQWTLFHEAGHLKNNDLTQGPLIFAATAMVVEAGYQMCKHKIIRPTSWPLYLGLHAVVYIGMMGSQDVLYNNYSRYREARADKFANKYSDDNALLGGKISLEKNEKIVSDAIIKSRYAFASHPTHESRIQAIDKEIIRRQTISK